MIILQAVVFTTAFSQDTTSTAHDTTVIYKNQVFTLSEVVVRNNFNVPAFIELVKNDTTFYKAFKNLRVLSFSSYNDIRLKNKKGSETASLLSTTRQNYENNCRTMETLE
ncbi:MAG TPA: hypothetical protein VF623_10985, partial [Segetibacter sp.]